MRALSLRGTVFLVLLLSGLAAPALQLQYATVRVRVTDSQGSALPGVTVTGCECSSCSDDCKCCTVRVTDAKGEVGFLNVPAGKFHLIAELEGFGTAEAEVQVAPGGAHDVSMTLGSTGTGTT